MRLDGKVAIVTGSSRGIGEAIAKLFAAEGASVVVNSRKYDSAKKVADEISELGGHSLPVKGDVSNIEDINKIISQTVGKYGKLDILVNNAGILIKEPLLEVSESSWQKIMDVDLKAVFFFLQAAAKQMIKQSARGKIINIASIAGEMGFSNISHYSIAKAGVIQLTRSAAVELAPYKINVNAIGPGVIKTEMTREMLSDSKYMDEFLAKIPLKEVARPDDIAPCAVYLASDESNYATGETIFVDGGWLAA